METKIFTSKHYRWDEFTAKLKHFLYAHTEGETDEGSCADNFHFTEKILNHFPGIDVEGSIENFKEIYGCKCDCTLAMCIC